MILLQESEQTVSFVPMSSCGPAPWYEKLFAFYLFFMLLVLTARGAQLAWNLVRLRHLQREGEAQRFRALRLAAHARAESLRRFSVLTAVLVLADFCLAAADILAAIGTTKTFPFHSVSLEATEQLRMTAFGLVVCAGLYAAAFFFQARLARRELSFVRENESRSTESTST